MLYGFHPSHFRVGKGLLLAGLAACPSLALAQSPVTSSYAGQNGRIASFVLACASVDGTFTAQPCGVAGFPVHVLVDGGSGSTGGGSTPTTAAGTPSSQVVGIQGAGAGALPVPVSQAGTWVMSPSNRSAAWSDSSAVAGTTSVILVAAASTRTGLHIVNNGNALACINWTAAATISGGACGLGSWPIPPGGGYTEDQPGNVSPEQINVVAAANTTLTVKVR